MSLIVSLSGTIKLDRQADIVVFKLCKNAKTTVIFSLD